MMSRITRTKYFRLLPIFMRISITSFLKLSVWAIASAQTTAPTESLDKQIATHFEKYQPELFRYSGLTFYGENQTTFQEEQVNAELELCNKVKSSPLLKNPTENVFALCHNILIHSPEKGKEFLKSLNEPTSDQAVLKWLYPEIMFAGEFGEGLALDNLESGVDFWRKTWSRYLSAFAFYESSIPRIEKMLKQTNDLELQRDLINALMYIGHPRSRETVKQTIESTTSDKVQATAIFAYAELTGYDGISYLKNVTTKGEKSKEEKTSSIDWLKKETSPKNRFGTEVNNNIGFIMRFGDIKSPAMVWLDKEGLLEEKKAEHPVPLTTEKKNKLIDLLIESKGFGLEAAKAQLFLSLEPSDLNKLFTLRQMCLYSPNDFTEGRLKTIGIFARSLRKRQ
jgi:hypothetical protein